MRNTTIALALSAAGLLLSACSNQGASDTGNKTSVLAGRVDAGPVDYRVETVAEGLDHPWSLAFLPGGELLVTERIGKLFAISADGSRRLLRDFNDNGNFPPVHHGDGMQAGLFDDRQFLGRRDEDHALYPFALVLRVGGWLGRPRGRAEL